MIYGWMNSAKGMRHIEIFANPHRRRVLDFAMPWDSSSSLGGGIVVDAVLGPFAVENTTIRFQVANQVMALHWDPLGDGNRDLFASDFLARNPLPS
jgi:hypothetical protein